jgi:vancomycin resistance protein YoaR
VEFSSEIRNGAATLVPVLSATKLSSFYAQIASKVAKEPVDASFASDGNKAWVVPAEPGQKFDPARTTEALKEAALRTTGRTAEVCCDGISAQFHHRRS